jgi:hypothetical protein
MRQGLALVALLLPLTGCVAPPPQPVGYGYYAQPGYPGAYDQPGYVGAYAQPDYGYPGFAYNDGSPTLFVEGATVPLIFFGGGWGYYDRDRRWHRAPDRVEHNLSQRFPGGNGYRPWGGGRPEGFRPEGPRSEGFRPEGPRPEGFRPEGPRAGGYPAGGAPWANLRPEGPRPEGFRPEGPRAGGYPAGGAPWANRPAGPPPGGSANRPAGPPPGGGFQPPVQRAAVPAARPEPAPQRHREDERH